MKNILISCAGILMILCIASQQANAFCGIGGFFGLPPAPTCTCSLNKVAIKRMSGNVCQEERCISQGVVQHYLNQGWIYGCCSSSRMGNEFDINNISAHSFPNPASSQVTTQMFLSNAEHISININDLNGRLVFTVADKYFEAGNSEVIWSTSDLNDGIYFLQMQSQELIRTEKLVISK